MDNKKDVPYIVYEGAEAKSERIIKRLLIMLAISVILIFASNMGWLYVWNSYDTVSYDQSGEGINNLNTGEQGDVVNESGTENKNQKK